MGWISLMKTGELYGDVDSATCEFIIYVAVPVKPRLVEEQALKHQSSKAP